MGIVKTIIINFAEVKKKEEKDMLLKVVKGRDYHLAAKNIKKFALKENSGQELSEEPVEMSAIVESMKQEAQPIGSAVGG